MALDKLVDSTQLDADLTTVANAIRTKGGTSAQLSFPSGMAQAIAAIPSGGGSLPSTWEYTTGEFTLASDITSAYQITHNLGVIPDIIYVVADADVDDVPPRTIMMACRFFSGKGVPFKDSLAVMLGLQQKSAYFESGNNSENHYVGYKSTSAYNLAFNDATAFIGVAADSTTFSFYGTSNRVMRTGIKYVWYAIKVN